MTARNGKAERHGNAETGAAGRLTRRAALPRAGAFWLVAAVLPLLLAAAGGPSPLYRVYQAEWRFSAITLTEVFAVYALSLLATLLVFGSLSDYLGRRRVTRSSKRRQGSCIPILPPNQTGPT